MVFEIDVDMLFYEFYQLVPEKISEYNQSIVNQTE